MWVVTKFKYDRFTGGLYHTKKTFRFFLPAAFYSIGAVITGGTVDLRKV